MIRLAGPGGAGKTTTGAVLARRLGMTFVDLDQRFAAAHGDISEFLRAHDYERYAERNVQMYVDVLANEDARSVVALSSGFMTYREDCHPAYASCRSAISMSRWTFVLLPSLDLERCVAETVRRQLGRIFSRSAEREEQVIRSRFPCYVNLPARKFETMKPVDAVADDLQAAIEALLLVEDGRTASDECACRLS